ncbi:reverse transcriptase domain-containing protein [Tanacetum coccineum]
MARVHRLPFFQIPIALEDQEKKTFICPYRTFAYRQMPFGLCNAPTTFQRCMTAIFHDMMEDFMEVFMDDFLVFVYGGKEGDLFRNEFSGAGMKLRIKKGAKNLAADHLSRLKNPNLGTFTKEEIADEFPDEHLMVLKTELNDDEPWYADYVNYIVGKIVPPNWTPEKSRRFFSQVKNYFWDEPYAFKLCPDNVMRRCVARNEILEILAHCHSGPTGGHHSASITQKHIIKERDASEQYSVAVDYISKWVEAQALPTNNARIVIRFLRRLFARFRVPKALIAATKNHFMELNELMELRDGAYENTGIYKERAKRWHDSRLRGDKNFKVGDKVLLFNSRFKMHPVMESTRRSSRRQPKIPNHFHDSIHDLNKKKDVMKNKATSVKGCVFDSVMDSQKNDSGNLVDSVGREDELKDTGLDIGEGVDVNIGNVESVKFGSVNDDMLKGNGGSHNVKLPNVRFCNPPLETLTMKGISALASRIGKPLIMDARTASMCTQNVGRIGYARVLIEVPAKKGLPDKIDIVYKNAAKEMCPKSTVVGNDEKINVANKEQREAHLLEEFTEVVNRRTVKQNVNKKKSIWGKQQNNKHALTGGGLNSSKTVFQPKDKGNYSNNTMKGNNPNVVKENNVAHKENVNEETPKKGKERKENPVGSATKEVNTSGNKFSVLKDLDYEEELYEMKGIKNNANIKKKTSLNGKEDWKHEMQKDNDDISVEMEDVYSMNDGMAYEMNKGDLKGMDGNVL